MKNDIGERQYRLEMLRSDNRTRAFIVSSSSIIRWGALVFIAYFFYKSIASLSGLETKANIVLNFLSDIKVNQWLAYILGFGGLFYGIGQRKSRHKIIKKTSGHIEKLEKRLNSIRQSSLLNHDGTTNEADL